MDNRLDNRYKRLENLFIAFLAIQTLFTLTALYLSVNDLYIPIPVELNYIKIFIMIQIFVTVVYGNYFFRSKFKLAEKEAEEESKHTHYYSAYSVRLVMLAISNVLNIIAFVITSNEIYIIVTVPLIFLYFIYKPERKVFEDRTKTADS
jgi:hypothetical protein